MSGKRDEPAGGEHDGAAQAVAGGDERHEHEPDEAVAQLHDGGEAEREPGAGRRTPLLVSAPA